MSRFDIYEEFDLTLKVGENYKFNKNKNMKNINWHAVRTIALLAIAFIVAGLQAIHGLTTVDVKIDMILPILLLIEHALAGNSNLTK